MGIKIQLENQYKEVLPEAYLELTYVKVRTLKNKVEMSLDLYKDKESKDLGILPYKTLSVEVTLEGFKASVLGGADLTNSIYSMLVSEGHSFSGGEIL